MFSFVFQMLNYLQTALFACMRIFKNAPQTYRLKWKVRDIQTDSFLLFVWEGRDAWHKRAREILCIKTRMTEGGRGRNVYCITVKNMWWFLKVIKKLNILERIHWLDDFPIASLQVLSVINYVNDGLYELDCRC